MRPPACIAATNADLSATICDTTTHFFELQSGLMSAGGWTGWRKGGLKGGLETAGFDGAVMKRRRPVRKAAVSAPKAQSLSRERPAWRTASQVIIS